MKKVEYLKYFKNNDFLFDINEGDFVNFYGAGNDLIINDIIFNKSKYFLSIGGIEYNKKNNKNIRKEISYIRNKDLNIFVSETVENCLAYGLENLGIPKNEIKEKIQLEAEIYDLTDLLFKSPDSLGISEKVLLKIASVLIYNPKILVLENVIDELDSIDRNRVIKILNEYIKKGNIVINFTSNINESLYGNRIIISDKEKIIADGKTLDILKEEKLLKKTGLYLPFIIEVNKYLIDYGIIKKYELDIEKLVNSIWK